MSKFPALDAKRDELNAAVKEFKRVTGEGGGLEAKSGLDLDAITSVKGSKEDKRMWINEQNARITDLRKQYDELVATRKSLSAGAPEDGSDTESGATSLGDAFVKSAAYTGRMRGGSGPVASVDMKTLFERTAGWAPEATRSGLVQMSQQRPAPHVIDSIPQSSISQVSYVYMEETTFTNAAAERAEGTGYPEAALALTQKSQPVEKVAVYLPMTDEQLEDVAGARSYVNDRLGLMLAQRIDSQVLTGNGSAPNLLGTSNVVGIQTANSAGDLIAAIATMNDTISESFAAAGASAIFMRPSVWTTNVALLTTSDGEYIWQHPTSNGPLTLWGTPVVKTMAVGATQVLMGDYQSHARLMFKRGVDFQVTNSHSTDFVNGKQTVRADVRLVMVHLRPSAFGEITITAA